MLSANSSYRQVCSGLSPPSYRPFWANHKRADSLRALILAGYHLLVFILRFTRCKLTIVVDKVEFVSFLLSCCPLSGLQAVWRFSTRRSFRCGRISGCQFRHRLSLCDFIHCYISVYIQHNSPTKWGWQLINCVIRRPFPMFFRHGLYDKELLYHL